MAEQRSAFGGSRGTTAPALPVVRPQDKAVDGAGELASVDLETRVLTGSGTRFTSLQPGCMVGTDALGHFTVASVESDTELTFKEVPSGLSNPLPLPAKYKVTPKIQHSEMFGKVTEALSQGRCVGIFPEGGSHDRTELLPLKVGVAIMALAALAEGIPVTICPVGINYFSGHVFRSTVFIDVGRHVQVAPELVKLYRDPVTRKVACQQLLEQMRSALDLVTIQAPDFETLKTIRTARRMYQGRVQLSAKEYMDLTMKFNVAYRLWKDEPEFAELLADIQEYLEFARSQGLKDKQVRDLPPMGYIQTLLNALYDVAATAVMALLILPLILPGLLLNAPLWWYINRELPKEMSKALSKSTVKIAARDVAASFQIMTSVKLIPLLHLAYSVFWLLFFVLTWDFYKRGEPGTWQHVFFYNAWWFLPASFLFLGPYYSFRVCPALIERLAKRLHLLPKYLLTIRGFFSNSTRAPAELLRQERKKLTVRVQDLVEKLISSYPEWDKERVINRAKILQRRSKSIKAIAKSGDLAPALPRSASRSILSTASSDKEQDEQHGRAAGARSPSVDSAGSTGSAVLVGSEPHEAQSPTSRSGAARAHGARDADADADADAGEIEKRVSRLPVRPSFVNLAAFDTNEE